MWKNLYQVAKNKYFLVTAFFLIWIGFFDQNDWVSRKEIDRKIGELEADREFFTSEVEALKERQQTLKEDADALERYAREKFYMKKKGEDVYIMVD